jgi:hypothetical protein
LQAIDGYDYVQARQIRPGRTHPSEGTGNDLHVDSARQEQGNEQLKFAIADQRVTPDDGQMQWLQSIDNFEYSVYQGLALSVVKVAQGLPAAQMRVVIGVATRTSQGAFTRNFYRKRRLLTPKNFAPCLNDLIGVHW